MRLNAVVLPAPFGPISAEHLTALHHEPEPAHGLEAAEPLREAAHLQQRRHARLRAWSRRTRYGYAPSGMNRTTAIRSRPYAIRWAPVHPAAPK